MVIKPAQSGVFLAEMNSPALKGGKAFLPPSGLILQQKFTTGSYFNLQLIRISDIFLIFFYNLK